MKENKIEKLILDLSNRWECTPQEAVDRLNSMNESEINKLINSMTKKFAKGGLIDCLRAGGSFQKCKCGDKVTKHQQTSTIGKQVDGMGLPVQLPNKTRDLKYSNIISNGVTGKAATWIPKDGKSQVTEFLMADNNPDVPGYANDIKMEISRNPRTGELGRDTVLRSKILPGIYGIGLPIKYRSDAPVVRNAKKRK